MSRRGAVAIDPRGGGRPLNLYPKRLQQRRALSGGNWKLPWREFIVRGRRQPVKVPAWRQNRIRVRITATTHAGVWHLSRGFSMANGGKLLDDVAAARAGSGRGDISKGANGRVAMRVRPCGAGGPWVSGRTRWTSAGGAGGKGFKVRSVSPMGIRKPGSPSTSRSVREQASCWAWLWIVWRLQGLSGAGVAESGEVVSASARAV